MFSKMLENDIFLFLLLDNYGCTTAKKYYFRRNVVLEFFPKGMLTFVKASRALAFFLLANQRQNIA